MESRIHVVNTFGTLFREHLQKFLPNTSCAIGDSGAGRMRHRRRGVVALNKITYIDLIPTKAPF